MNRRYEDILSRVLEAPKWYDEHAVPRYCEFSPQQIADVYAQEAALVEVACQGCGCQFHVAISVSKPHPGRHKNGLESSIRDHSINYGDPPNIGCCPSGPAMLTETIRVLQFWRRQSPFVWTRDRELEIDITR